jgi:NTE family protein
VNALVDNQVRDLRKRQTIEAFRAGRRTGAYWGIRTDIAEYGVPAALACPLAQTRVLAAVKTRLQRMPDALQERLINWGYAVCDAAVRAHVDGGMSAPHGFPYPDRAVG